MSNESALNSLEDECPESIIDSDKKIHPWRICPIGTHLVKEHPLRIPPNKKHPDGLNVIRHQHCASNPSKKDLLSFEEIQQMSIQYFGDLVGPPSSGILKFQDADKFDNLIRGWVRYWNDIFKPIEHLDPNLVKALIAKSLDLNLQQRILSKKFTLVDLCKLLKKHIKP